ncbi:MAG: acyltransferase [Clostridia bacterium]|nr:acyltransferase [Clostridia bacterium]
MRNKGVIYLGKNMKIDSVSVIASNGGFISLGDSVGIGKNNIIVSQEKIVIGDGVILSPNVFIYDHDHEFDYKSGVKVKDYRRESIVIGKNCWIGANTVILRGTHIGDNCLVGAGCVLKWNYPNGSKIIQKRQTTIIEET